MQIEQALEIPDTAHDPAPPRIGDNGG